MFQLWWFGKERFIISVNSLELLCLLCACFVWKGQIRQFYSIQDVWIWFSPLFCLFFFTIEKLCISEQNYLYQHLIEQQNSRGPEEMLRRICWLLCINRNTQRWKTLEFHLQVVKKKKKNASGCWKNHYLMTRGWDPTINYCWRSETSRAKQHSTGKRS